MLFSALRAVGLALGGSSGLALAASLYACDAPDGESTAPPRDVPPASVYDDLGPLNGPVDVSALLALELKTDAEGRSVLETIDAISDPSSPAFHRYLTAAEFVDRFAPSSDEVLRANDWLTSNGLSVTRVATNRLLIAFAGKAADVNRAFGIELHLFARKGEGLNGTILFGAEERPQVPAALAGIMRTAITFTPVGKDKTLSPEATRTVSLPPNIGEALVPEQVARAYGFDALAARGARGAGATIGVVIGETIKMNDVREFWRSFGISRKDPVIVTPLGAPSTRVPEGALDVEWAGAMAPGADLVVYAAPDIDERSLLFTFNEAIGLGQVDVLTDSFVHRETTVGPSASEQYESSARMAAAIGITVVSATGDSGGVDVPAVAPHVTAVGGTALSFEGDVLRESVWSKSGAGPSRYFDRPHWQAGASDKRGRAVADVSLNAESHYWMLYLGEWQHHGGTSFSSPVFAALMAVIDGERHAAGRPKVGFLNRVLYSNVAVQASFRDIVEGSTGDFVAQGGWDHASGWGAPRGAALAEAMP